MENSENTTTTRPVPMVLRSQRELPSGGLLPGSPRGAAPAALPITDDGVTYSMAQELTWLDGEHFAVGRWDGSLSIFRYSTSPTAGPLLTTASSNPSSEGVQMIVWLAPFTFAASMDDESIAVWRTASRVWTDLGPPAILRYDPSLGTANSGEAFILDTTLWLVVGHAGGFVTLWSGALDASDLCLVRSVDLRSAHPVNPWQLHNIRGVSLVASDGAEGHVVTGSEDGDLCIVRVPDGAVVSRTVYNPSAQRGINSVATAGMRLLVANCSVGENDKNLWYYAIDSSDWSIRLLDSANLKVNPAAAQVFNFCTIWAKYDAGLCFFSSTEEGALWMGTAPGGRLAILGYEPVTIALGAALGWNAAGQLALVNYNLHEFRTFTSPRAVPERENPERVRE